MNKVPPLASLQAFALISDPRRDHPTTRHTLYDILTLTLLATLCGASNWVEIEQWGRAQLDWLCDLLALPQGVPSHDTLGRVFSLLDPEALAAAFLDFNARLAGRIEGVVCLDGKTVRHSLQRAEGRGPIHLVSAFAQANSLVLAQLRVEDKENEIVALPRLIQMLDLRGCLVTLDAMGCQVSIAQAILEAGGDYLLRVKDNQKGLRVDIQELFDWALDPRRPAHQHAEWVEHVSWDKGHGRIEQRACVGIDLAHLGGLSALERWPGVGSVWRVSARRESGEQSSQEEPRYYLCSRRAQEAARAAEMEGAVRAHWSIENQLHWVLDVAMGEDDNRARTGHSAENQSLMRKWALNVLRQDDTLKVGIKAKQKRAGWDRDYLLHLLSAKFF